jgi:hypothetical protein
MIFCGAWPYHYLSTFTALQQISCSSIGFFFCPLSDRPVSRETNISANYLAIDKQVAVSSRFVVGSFMNYVIEGPRELTLISLPRYCLMVAITITPV